MGDPPVEFVWHDGPVPAGLPVTQVYGWLLCPATGRPRLPGSPPAGTAGHRPAQDGRDHHRIRAPDPDNGRLNRRYMTSLAAAPSVLGCGQPAEAQARAAAAGRRWGLRVDHPAAAGYEE